MSLSHRRMFVAILMSMLFVLFVSGPSMAVTTINLHHAFNGDLDQADIKDIVAAFEAQNPDIKVNIEMFDYGTYFGGKLAIMGASGTLGDVFLLNDSPAPTYHASGISMNLEPLMARDKMSKSDFWAAQLPLMSVNGNLHGLPFDFSTNGYYYNTNMFDQAGVAYPTEAWTWDNALAIAKKMTMTDGTGKKVTFGIGRSRLWDWELVGYLRSFGADLLTADNKKMAINSPAAGRAIQFMSDLVNVEGVVPTWRDMDNPVTGFFNGKVAMVFDGSWAVTRFNKNSLVPFDITYVPAGPSGRYVSSTGSHWSMFSGTKHQEEAWKLLKFITGTEGIEMFVSRHLKSLPGRRSALPLWNKTAAQLGSPKSAAILGDTVGRFAAMIPVTPAWDALSQIINNNVTRVMDGKATTAEVLEAIEKEGNAALAAVK